MQNLMIALIMFFSMISFSYAGDCANGNCNLQSRKVVTTTKQVVRNTTYPIRRVFSGPSCANGTCRSRSTTTTVIR